MIFAFFLLRRNDITGKYDNMWSFPKSFPTFYSDPWGSQY